MNPHIDEDAILEDAAKHQERLLREAEFRMLRMGQKDAADKLLTPEAQDNIARGALGHAILDNTPQEREGSKGPARRKRPKVNARKRQRQARKRQR